MFMLLSGKDTIMKPNRQQNAILGSGLGTCLPPGAAGTSWNRIRIEKTYEKSVFCGLTPFPRRFSSPHFQC